MDEFGTSAAVWDGDSPVTSPQEPSSTLSWAGEGDGQHEQCQCSSGDGRPCVCQGYSGIWDFDEPEVGANSFHGVSDGPAHHGSGASVTVGLPPASDDGAWIQMHLQQQPGSPPPGTTTHPKPVPMQQEEELEEDEHSADGVGGAWRGVLQFAGDDPASNLGLDDVFAGEESQPVPWFGPDPVDVEMCDDGTPMNDVGGRGGRGGRGSSGRGSQGGAPSLGRGSSPQPIDNVDQSDNMDTHGVDPPALAKEGQQKIGFGRFKRDTRRDVRIIHPWYSSSLAGWDCFHQALARGLAWATKAKRYVDYCDGCTAAAAQAANVQAAHVQAERSGIAATAQVQPRTRLPDGGLRQGGPQSPSSGLGRSGTTRSSPVFIPPDGPDSPSNARVVSVTKAAMARFPSMVRGPSTGAEMCRDVAHFVGSEAGGYHAIQISYRSGRRVEMSCPSENCQFFVVASESTSKKNKHLGWTVQHQKSTWDHHVKDASGHDGIGLGMCCSRRKLSSAALGNDPAVRQFLLGHKVADNVDQVRRNTL